MGRRRDIIGVIETTGNELKTTKVSVSATATALPTAPMENRKAIVIRNYSNTNTIFIGSLAVTTDGYPVLPYESLPLTMSDGATIYAICEAGKTADVRVLEVNND